MLPNWIIDSPELSANQKLVLLGLRRNAYGKQRVVNPAQVDLAKTLGIHRNTVRRALTDLTVAGLVRPLKAPGKGREVKYELRLDAPGDAQSDTISISGDAQSDTISISGDAQSDANQLHNRIPSVAQSDAISEHQNTETELENENRPKTYPTPAPPTGASAGSAQEQNAYSVTASRAGATDVAKGNGTAGSGSAAPSSTPTSAPATPPPPVVARPARAEGGFEDAGATAVADDPAVREARRVGLTVPCPDDEGCAREDIEEVLFLAGGEPLNRGKLDELFERYGLARCWSQARVLAERLDRSSEMVKKPAAFYVQSVEQHWGRPSGKTWRQRIPEVAERLDNLEIELLDVPVPIRDDVVKLAPNYLRYAMAQAMDEAELPRSTPSVEDDDLIPF